MFDEGFFHRFKKSFDRVLFGLDLILSAGIVVIVFLILGEGVANYDTQAFVRQATSLSTSLVAVILTGIAILVSLSHSEALKALKERRLYERFLFTFEFTAMIALVVTVFGILLQTYNFGTKMFYIFSWTFSYMVLAAATVISRLITYGDKMAQIVVIESLPDDLGEQLQEIQEGEEDEDKPKDADSTVE